MCVACLCRSAQEYFCCVLYLFIVIALSFCSFTLASCSNIFLSVFGFLSNLNPLVRYASLSILLYNIFFFTNFPRVPQISHKRTYLDILIIFVVDLHRKRRNAEFN